MNDTVVDFNFPNYINYDKISQNVFKNINDSNYISFIVVINKDTIDSVRNAKFINVDIINNHFNKYENVYLFIFCNKLTSSGLNLPSNLILGSVLSMKKN